MQKLNYALLLCFFLSSQVLACTTILWNNSKAIVAGRSVDLYTSDQPHIVVMPRGIQRNGDAGENSITWRSKYGSVVITAFNTNAVSDGLNEKGLTAHLLYLDKTQYPKRDLKIPGLSNVLWPQYFLDNFATVHDAIAAINRFQLTSKVVSGREWPLHLALQDATGNAAIIELIDGKVKVYEGKQYTVMTNEPAYNIQLSNLKRYRSFGGTLSLPGDSDPLSRFVRAATYLKTLPAPHNQLEALAGTLAVMRTVAVPFGAVDHSGNQTEDAWPTRWITLADLTHKIYYFNSTTTPNIVWLDFKNLNFKEGAASVSLDPQDMTLIGEISGKLSD